MSNDPFGPDYASSYDSLYGDKDYDAECDVLERVFRTYATGSVRTVLDVGCGTGAHAVRLARRGYEVTGVDASAEMLTHAREKAGSLSHAGDAKPPRFCQGDARSLQLGETFDAAILMFAVLGYQLTNKDVLDTLRGARRHVRPGGVLVFDVWFGPAVTRIGPSQQVRVVQTGDRRIIRVADGDLDERHSSCRVSYRLWELAQNRLVAETEETHTVRFFFPLELESLLEQCGFELKRLAAFPDIDADASAEVWNALVVAT